MNSFTLTAVGNLARNPEAVAKGDITFTRFCLVGNDYAGKDDEGAPREIVTTLWFVAFGPLAESLVRGARKGDQLIVEARVRSNNWTDRQGEKQYDHDFVVQGYRYGAPGKIKREERKFHREEGAQRAEDRSNNAGNVNADQGSTGPDDGNADRTDRGSNTQTNAENAGNGASMSDGNHKSAGASGNTSEKAVEKPVEKPNGSRSGRRAVAPPP